MDVGLYADTREVAVNPFLVDQPNVTVMQMTTGDYAIVRVDVTGKTTILAIIERKTLCDYARSFCDDRYSNFKKMFELRRRTGCVVMLIVEGPAFPSPSRRFDRIPYANILASMTNLMVRDGVYVVQTEDPQHTAKRLLDITRSYSECVCLRTASGAPPACGSVAAGARDQPTDVIDELTRRHKPSVLEEAVAAWGNLKGVSCTLARILAGRFSVRQLAGGMVRDDTLVGFRGAGGRKIHRFALDSLRGIRMNDRLVSLSLLKGINGVSAAVADAVLGRRTIAELSRMSPDALAATPLEQKGRTVRLGATRAQRILEVLNFVGSADASPPGHVLGVAGGAHPVETQPDGLPTDSELESLLS